MNEERMSPFRDAHTDRDTAEQIPDTPQTRAPAYRLAFADEDFMCRDELRPVRLQLELLKPEMILNEKGIESTIVLFGGARIPEPDKKGAARTKTLADLSRFYDEARTFARLMTAKSMESYGRENVIVTGGDRGSWKRGTVALWTLEATLSGSISCCRMNKRQMNMSRRGFALTSIILPFARCIS